MSEHHHHACIHVLAQVHAARAMRKAWREERARNGFHSITIPMEEFDKTLTDAPLRTCDIDAMNPADAYQLGFEAGARGMKEAMDALAEHRAVVGTSLHPAYGDER